jgi:molybdopterin-guanine dinucleotide biosynthesis protein A/rhodanese-related sulfurtransferase
MAFSGIVLCGGQSSRMGQDKALMDVGGRALAVAVADALAAAGASGVQAWGGNETALTSLGLDWVADRWPGRGPAVAVADALTRCDADIVVVVACDHPDINAAAVQMLVSALDGGDNQSGPHDDTAGDQLGGRGQVAAAVAVDGLRSHPTVSAWRTTLCAPIAGQWMATGASSLGSLVAAVRARHRVVDVAVDHAVVRDLDTPADVSRYDRQTPQPVGVMPGQEPIVDIPEIDVAALAEKLDGGSRLFDVRQPDEYVEAHVPGAVLIPLAEVPDRVDDFAGDDTVYVICRSGARSARAVEYLRANDVDAVNVIGGTMAWMESGAETARGDQPG